MKRYLRISDIFQKPRYLILWNKKNKVKAVEMCRERERERERKVVATTIKLS
jgi:hypothetical protein